jgi:hypothetical protein
LKDVHAVNFVQGVSNHDLSTFVSGAWSMLEKRAKACKNQNGAKKDIVK